MPAKTKGKTLDEHAAALQEDGFRVQRDAHGTITAYERGDRPADTTGALSVGESGEVERITLHDGSEVACTAKQPGDHPETIARVNDVPVRLVDGKLHAWQGVDEDGEDILEEVTA
jgi:hypothetical protein